MKFMQHLETMSILELPLARVAGNPKNVRVFMEFEAAGKDGEKKDVGRVEFELFSAALPRTCENFRSFCTGERGNGVQSGKPMHYKGVRLHRVIKGFMTQGGDTVRGDGTGTESIFGPMFPDEWAENKTHVKHQKAGMLAMANAGPDPTDPNSTSRTEQPRGSTASTSCSGKSWTVWSESNGSRQTRGAPAGHQRSRWSSRTAAR